MDAAGSGLYEVRSSQAALLKSNDERVKSIAQRMIDDHGKANDRIVAIARSRGEMIDAKLTTEQEGMLAKLNGLSGADFDREYLRQQTTAHQIAVDKFKQESKSGGDAEARQFASDTLPTLREHLRMVSGESVPSNIGSEK